MKAQNRKLSSRAYRVHDRSRLSFQGNWYVSPGLLNRLAGREFEIYYDRRDISVIYLFVDGSYVGEAYCPAFMGQRISEWEAKAMRRADTKSAKAAGTEVAAVRAQIQEDIETTKKQRERLCEQERRLDSWTDNARKSIRRMWLKRSQAWLRPNVWTESSPKQPLTHRKCIRRSPWSSGIVTRRETDGAAAPSSLQWLH